MFLGVFFAAPLVLVWQMKLVQVFGVCFYLLLSNSDAFRVVSLPNLLNQEFPLYETSNSLERMRNSAHFQCSFYKSKYSCLDFLVGGT